MSAPSFIFAILPVILTMCILEANGHFLQASLFPGIFNSIAGFISGIYPY